MESTQKYNGLKELNSVVIKAYSDITIGNRRFSAGEPILYFEKVQISELNESTKPVMARGGWGNYPHVIWEDFNGFGFTLTEGVLSTMSFSILSNAELFDYEEGQQTIKLPKREKIEVRNGKIKAKYQPLKDRFFIYSLDEDGIIENKIENYSINDNNKEITISTDYNKKEVLIDYYFNYQKAYTKYIIGNKRIAGFLSLEGKAYFKDEIEGLNKTFFFEIPKMKITSNLDIVMGEKASPTISVFNIIGVPIKENNQWVVSRMYLLDDDIDSDI